MPPKKDSQRIQEARDLFKQKLERQQQQKQVQTEVEDDTILVSGLASFLTCSLCSGYLINATTIINCVHTFCRSCIVKVFQTGRLHCPKCKILIHPSDPFVNMRYDSTIQDIVYKIFPDLQQKEKKLEEEFYASQNMPMPNSGLHHSASRYRQKRRRRCPIAINRVYITLHYMGSTVNNEHLVPVSKKFISVPSKTTIKELQTYVARKMFVTVKSQVQFFIETMLISSAVTMAMIQEIFYAGESMDTVIELGYCMLQPHDYFNSERPSLFEENFNPESDLKEESAPSVMKEGSHGEKSSAPDVDYDKIAATIQCVANEGFIGSEIKDEDDDTMVKVEGSDAETTYQPAQKRKRRSREKVPFGGLNTPLVNGKPRQRTYGPRYRGRKPKGPKAKTQEGTSLECSEPKTEQIPCDVASILPGTSLLNQETGSSMVKDEENTSKKIVHVKRKKRTKRKNNTWHDAEYEELCQRNIYARQRKSRKCSSRYVDVADQVTCHVSCSDDGLLIVSCIDDVDKVQKQVENAMEISDGKAIEMDTTEGNAQQSDQVVIEPKLISQKSNPAGDGTVLSDILTTPKQTTPIKDSTGCETTPVKAFSGREITSVKQTTPVKASTGCGTTPVKASTGCETTPIKTSTGCVTTPVKASTGCETTPIKTSTGCVTTPVKASTGCETAPVKASTRFETTPIKASTRCETAPVKTSTGCETAPVKNSTVCETTPVKASTGYETTPVKSSTGCETTPLKASTSLLATSDSDNNCGITSPGCDEMEELCCINVEQSSSADVEQCSDDMSGSSCDMEEPVGDVETADACKPTLDTTCANNDIDTVDDLQCNSDDRTRDTTFAPDDQSDKSVFTEDVNSILTTPTSLSVC